MFKTFISKLLPGRRDGLVLSVILAAFAASTIVWLNFAANLFGFVIGAVAAIALTVLLGLFDFWVLFTDRSIAQRICVSVGFNILLVATASASAALAAPYSHEPTAQFAIQWFSVLALQRLAVFLAVVLISLPFRAFSGWRLATREKDGSLSVRTPTISIATFMSATALLAVILSGWSWTKGLEYELEIFDLSFVSVMAVLSAFELSIFALFVIPTMVVLWSRRPNGRFSWVMPIIGIAVVIAILVFLVAVSAEAIVDEVGSIFWLIVPLLVVGAAVFGIRLMLRTWGYQFAHKKKEELWTAHTEQPKVLGWMGFLLSFLLIGLAVFSYFTYELPILVQSGSPSLASAARKVSSSLGVVPFVDNTTEWSAEVPAGISQLAITGIHHDPPYFQFTAHCTDGRPVIAAMANYLDFVKLSTRGLQPEHLKAVEVLEELDTLRIQAPELDSEQFSQLMKNGPRLRCVELWLLDKVQKEHIQTLMAHKIRDVHFISRAPVVIDEDTQLFFDSLPINSLHVQYASTHLPKFESNKDLRGLRIHDSPVDEIIAAQIAANPSMTRLSLTGCRITDDALYAICRLPYEVTIRDCNPPLSYDRLVSLAKLDTAEVNRLKIMQSNLTPYDIAKLSRFAGIGGTTFTNPENSDEYGNFNEDAPQFFKKELAKHGGSAQATLEAIAHDVELNTEGQIVSLDIVDMPLELEMLRAIQTQPALRALRIADSRNPFYHFASPELEPSEILDSMNLTTFELPYESHFDDEWLTEISKLQSLEHLALPISEISGFDQIPIDKKVVEYLKDDLVCGPFVRELERLTADYTREDFDESVMMPAYPISPTGILSLKNLTNMKSLVLPGPLLDSNFLTVCESWPELRKLNAPFSLLEPKAMARIGGLSQLEVLSVGTTPTDLEQAYEMFSRLSNLTTLQLFVLDERGHLNASEIESRLKEVCPNTTIHLILYGTL